MILEKEIENIQTINNEQTRFVLIDSNPSKEDMTKTTALARPLSISM